ncbi:MAG: isoprenylcysteine carboxylmethyltransferase family protein [Pseudomonadota bacterium]|nr:isoprenylcysteine carboxylmethyltransferase family protein [Pseudomonadota bacterium]
MYLPSPVLIGVAFGLSELALSLSRRAGSDANAKDRHSLLLIWAVVAAAMLVGVFLALQFPNLTLPHARALYFVGLVIFLAGLALRWYAIRYLGRWFTVNVAIAEDQPLIDTGPYALMRHPSYTGALMAFLGFALCLGNLTSLMLVVAATVAVFSWRIHIEEKVLAQAFGQRWQDYCARTKRLIPGIY